MFVVEYSRSNSFVMRQAIDGRDNAYVLAYAMFYITKRKVRVLEAIYDSRGYVVSYEEIRVFDPQMVLDQFIKKEVES